LIDKAGTSVDLDDADIYFTPVLRPEQMRPKGIALGVRPEDKSPA
jgi:hypothetical protein